MIKLINDDCLQFIKTLKDETIDLIITDPPYKTITGGRNNGKNINRPKGILTENRNLFKYQNNISMKEWLPEIYRVLKQKTHCYIFINSLNMQELLVEASNVGFKLINILVWQKNNCTPSQYYMKNCEYVLFLRKGSAKYINNIGISKTVHSFNNIIGNKTHPTEKPVDLLQFYIENSSLENDIILDPFMGTGSCGVAANNLNRNFIGIELEENYYNIAVDRLKIGETTNEQ